MPSPVQLAFDNVVSWHRYPHALATSAAILLAGLLLPPSWGSWVDTVVDLRDNRRLEFQTRPLVRQVHGHSLTQRSDKQVRRANISFLHNVTVSPHKIITSPSQKSAFGPHPRSMARILTLPFRSNTSDRCFLLGVRSLITQHVVSINLRYTAQTGSGFTIFSKPCLELFHENRNSGATCVTPYPLVLHRSFSTSENSHESRHSIGRQCILR